MFFYVNVLIQLLEEIADLEEDIRRLEADLRAKLAPLKVAHTRLEARTYRPNVDLTRDEVRINAY